MVEHHQMSRAVAVCLCRQCVAPSMPFQSIPCPHDSVDFPCITHPTHHTLIYIIQQAIERVYVQTRSGTNGEDRLKTASCVPVISGYYAASTPLIRQESQVCFQRFVIPPNVHEANGESQFRVKMVYGIADFSHQLVSNHSDGPDEMLSLPDSKKRNFIRHTIQKEIAGVIDDSPRAAQQTFVDRGDTVRSIASQEIKHDRLGILLPSLQVMKYSRQI
jgi:hypothetical protein